MRNDRSRSRAPKRKLQLGNKPRQVNHRLWRVVSFFYFQSWRNDAKRAQPKWKKIQILTFSKVSSFHCQILGSNKSSCIREGNRHFCQEGEGRSPPPVWKIGDFGSFLVLALGVRGGHWRQSVWSSHPALLPQSGRGINHPCKFGDGKNGEQIKKIVTRICKSRPPPKKYIAPEDLYVVLFFSVLILYLYFFRGV